MSTFYVNTYGPLVASKAGREACAAHGLPPFVDGSIRREPDLEHEFPSISCLCRAGNFAPRLRVGDVVAYMTKKARYRSRTSHWRLTAVLEVRAVLASHLAGAQWYRERGLTFPSNCWVHGNPAKPFEQSHRIFRASSCAGPKRTYREWDATYRLRAMKHGTFVVCTALFRDLSWDAPIIERRHFLRALGKVPGTHNPGALTMDQCCRLMRVIEIDIPLSDQ
jgi:hypothetical protein